jgi:hypothetical protein
MKEKIKRSTIDKALGSLGSISGHIRQVSDEDLLYLRKKFKGIEKHTNKISRELDSRFSKTEKTPSKTLMTQIKRLLSL